MQSKIAELLHQYFELGVAEGREGRNHDTEAGDAQRVLSEIEAEIAALSTVEPVGVRCTGCGSSWDDERLAEERAKRPALLSCCPERKVIKVYAAPPAPSVAVEEGQMINNMLLSQILQNAFFAGRGTSGAVSREDMAAWQDYDPYHLEAFKRIRSALSAQVQDESEIVDCLLAGKPFVFDPATNFCHADDGGAPEHGIKYVPAAQVQDVAGWQNEDKLTPDEAWTILCETPDITSPKEYPDHALITFEQLQSYMERAIVPDGWQLVPKEPTAGMIAAAKSTTSAALTRSHATEIYRAMLAAAPAKQEG